MSREFEDRRKGEQPAGEGGQQDERSGMTPAFKKRRRNRRIVGAVVIVAVLVVAGVGFMVWHEQPSFCAAICHTPMDEYLETYDQEPNTTGVDKWGNEVENTSAMLSVSHKENGDTCMSCHVPTMSEQVSEGLGWVTGDYYDPLYETDLTQLTAARGASSDEFCLNESCHNLTRDDLKELTSNYERNPHDDHHAQFECSTCHKGHRASVMYCAECHSDAEVPEGWITPAQEDELSQ